MFCSPTSFSLYLFHPNDCQYEYQRTFVESAGHRALRHIDLQAVALEEGHGRVEEHRSDLERPVSRIPGQLVQHFRFRFQRLAAALNYEAKEFAL